MSKFFIESVDVHPDFSSSTVTMTSQTPASMPIISESGVTISSLNSETVTSSSYTNQSVTYVQVTAADYISDIYFQVQSQSFLTFVENTYSEVIPDLPCSSSGSTSITFSLAAYNGGSVPSWITIDSTLGTLKITAPSVTTNTDYSFYINSQLSGFLDPVQKLIGIRVNKWTVTNWNKWTTSSTIIWEIWNTGYTKNSGNWLSQSSNSGTGSSNPNPSTTSTSETSQTVKSLDIATKSAAGATTGAVVLSSIISTSSFASVWLMINQLQMFFLLLLTGVYFPKDAIDAILGSKIFLFPFSYVPFIKINMLSKLSNYFQIDQNDLMLEKIGVESESTFLNIYSFSCSFLFAVIFHLIVAIVYRWSTWLNSPKRWKFLSKIIRLAIVKLFYFLTFGYYIRSLIETYQYMLISSISEIKNISLNSLPKIISFSISIALVVLWVGFLLFSFIVSRKINQIHHEEREMLGEFFIGLKRTKAARLYTVFLLLRRLAFVSLLITLASVYSFYTMLALIIIQLCYFVFLVIVRPFDEIKNNIIEIMNELYFGILLWWLFYFKSEDRWTATSTNLFIWIIWSNNFAILCIVLGKLVF